MGKRYRITLEVEERQGLEQLLAKGKADVRRLKHAQILLMSDESQRGSSMACGTHRWGGRLWAVDGGACPPSLRGGGIRTSAQSIPFTTTRVSSEA